MVQFLGGRSKGLFLLQKLFFRTYDSSFIKTNSNDIMVSVTIYGILYGFTSFLPMVLIPSLVRSTETQTWIFLLRFLSLSVCLMIVLFSYYRFKFFERYLFHFMILFILLQMILFIPMMILDVKNQSYYLYTSALVVTSSSIILWIEPIRIVMLCLFHFIIFLPLHFNFMAELRIDDFDFKQDCLLVFFLVGAGFAANLLINYWRIEEFRSKTRLRVTVKKLLKINKKIEELSRIDSMTKLYNRRHLMEQFEIYKKRARRESFTIGLLIIDLDKLKYINDKFGHKQGDLTIQAFSKVLKSRIRATDIAARIGGDEFCVLAAPIDKGGLLILTENIRHQIENMEIPIFGNESNSIHCTVSIGATLFPGSYETSFNKLYHQNDIALYDSKKEGRNRVTITEIK